jgi:hypothetical protein
VILHSSRSPLRHQNPISSEVGAHMPCQSLPSPPRIVPRHPPQRPAQQSQYSRASRMRATLHGPYQRGMQPFGHCPLKTLFRSLLAIAGLLVVSACGRSPSEPALLVADPSSVLITKETGSTTIIWNTGSESAGQVWVSGNGGAEVLFAQGTSGEKEADWIQPDSQYEFRLYSGLEHRVLLSRAKVRTSSTLGDQLRMPVRTGVAPSRLYRIAILTLAGIVLLSGPMTTCGKSSDLASWLVSGSATVLVIAVMVSMLLTRERSLSTEQPQPDASEYADAALHLARGEGHVTTHETMSINPGLVAPRYPSGYSLALTPFAAPPLGYPANVLLGAKAISALFVLVPTATAWTIGGPGAGSLVAAMLGLSPFTYASAVSRACLRLKHCNRHARLGPGDGVPESSPVGAHGTIALSPSGHHLCSAARHWHGRLPVVDVWQPLCDRL